jgi:large subunit ribosomal protein L15
MNLSDVSRSGRPKKKPKRVGRGPGSGHGKTSGRGHKGSQARTGYGANLTKEGGQMPLFRRLPKRGFGNSLFRKEYEPVNVRDLGGFEENAVVGPEEMREHNVTRGDKPVKVLGTGSIERPLTVRAHKFSKSAVEKIEAAGGSVVLITSG